MMLYKSIHLQPLEKGLFLLVILLHIILALSVHLSPDEAHYALYATHLDWSYYDHPPMVGWLQWFFLQWSQTDLVMRLAPMISWTMGLYLSIVLYHRLRNDLVLRGENKTSDLPQQHHRVGSVMVLWVTSPLLNLLGFALVPDCLLLPLVSAIMLLTWEMTHKDGMPELQQWVGLGILLGLSGLSKYTAVLLACSAAFVLLYAHGLKLLKEKRCWLAFIIAILLITPIIYWNFKHEWSSFVYQFGHASGSQSWQVRKIILYLLVLMLAFGPLLFVAFIFKLGKIQKNNHESIGQETSKNFTIEKKSDALSVSMFTLAYGLPTALLLIFLAGRGSTLPHWMAPAYVALIPLGALGLDQWQERKPKIWLSILSFQVFCLFGLLGLIFSGGFGDEKGQAAISLAGEKPTSSKPNPFADLIGWDQAAKRAIELANQNRVNTLAVMNWTLASRVAWYARPMPVKVIQSHHDQFDLWFGTIKPHEDVILLDWSLMTYDPPVSGPEFESCHLLEQIPIFRMGRQIAHFNFLLCTNWQSN